MRTLAVSALLLLAGPTPAALAGVDLKSAARVGAIGSFAPSLAIVGDVNGDGRADVGTGLQRNPVARRSPRTRTWRSWPSAARRRCPARRVPRLGDHEHRAAAGAGRDRRARRRRPGRRDDRRRRRLEWRRTRRRRGRRFARERERAAELRLRVRHPRPDDPGPDRRPQRGGRHPDRRRETRVGHRRRLRARGRHRRRRPARPRDRPAG